MKLCDFHRHFIINTKRCLHSGITELKKDILTFLWYLSQNCHWNNDNFARGPIQALKQSGFFILIDAHKPLCFDVGALGKKGIITFLGIYLKMKDICRNRG